MFFYRQFRKKLTQTAKKLNLQLIKIVNIAVTQAFTPPPQTRKQTKSILLSAALFPNTAGMVKQFEQFLQCN